MPEPDPDNLSDPGLGNQGNGRPWLRCYRCWSQNLEAQVHYDAILKINPMNGEPGERVDEVQEAVVQCLDCMHDQPHLTFADGRIEAVEDRWERMVTGTPWVASCTVMVDQEMVEACSGPEAADSLTYAAFGDWGTREFFTARPLPQARRGQDHDPSTRRALRPRLGGGVRRAGRGLTRRPDDHFAGRREPAAGGGVRRVTLAASRTLGAMRGQILSLLVRTRDASPLLPQPLFQRR